jgi:hypothetical protein
MTDSTRYKHLKGHLYYDNQEKVIVQNMGNRYVFVRHDRRGTGKAVDGVKRREDDRTPKGYLLVSASLYFDTVTHQLYKKIGPNFVLYTKDRRKGKKTVAVDRRKRP